MTIIEGRQEIAKALNFNTYPVLDIDLDTMETIEKNDGTTERYCKGCDVRVEYNTKRYGAMHTHGHIYFDAMGDENALDHMEISASGTCLHDSFGYHDVMEDLRWAKAPIVRAGQEVIVVVHSSKSNLYLVCKYTVSDRIDPHCITCATLSNPPQEGRTPPLHHIERSVTT